MLDKDRILYILKFLINTYDKEKFLREIKGGIPAPDYEAIKRWLENDK